MDKKMYYKKLKMIITSSPGTQNLIKDILEFKLGKLMEEFDSAQLDDAISPHVIKGGRRELNKLLKDISKSPWELEKLADG